MPINPMGYDNQTNKGFTNNYNKTKVLIHFITGVLSSQNARCDGNSRWDMFEHLV